MIVCGIVVWTWDDSLVPTTVLGMQEHVCSVACRMPVSRCWSGHMDANEHEHGAWTFNNLSPSKR
jgi:hypothetical protein